MFIDRDYTETENPEDYTFIQSLVWENKFIMEKDPTYVKTLENLPEDRKRAMLYGEWDVYEGQYFTEFSRDIHVVDPFEIPQHWKRYITMDYGLDMLAVLWIARDTEGNAYVYKEIHQPNLIISEACQKIKEMNNGDKYECIYAPRDLWNRRQETGKSVADIFAENGVNLVQTSVDRVDGWLATKEWLKVLKKRDIVTGEEERTSNLKIFRNCQKLIKHLPMLQHDEKDPNDIATEPHEPTHIADALRYWCVNYTNRASVPAKDVDKTFYTKGELEDFMGYKDTKRTLKVQRR